MLVDVLNKLYYNCLVNFANILLWNLLVTVESIYSVSDNTTLYILARGYKWKRL